MDAEKALAEVKRLDRANKMYLMALCDCYEESVIIGRIHEWAECLRAFANLAESFAPKIYKETDQAKDETWKGAHP